MFILGVSMAFSCKLLDYCLLFAAPFRAPQKLAPGSPGFGFDFGFQVDKHTDCQKRTPAREEILLRHATYI